MLSVCLSKLHGMKFPVPSLSHRGTSWSSPHLVAVPMMHQRGSQVYIGWCCSTWKGEGERDGKVPGDRPPRPQKEVGAYEVRKAVWGWPRVALTPGSRLGFPSRGNREPLRALEAKTAMFRFARREVILAAEWRKEERSVLAELLSERPLSSASLSRVSPHCFPRIPGSRPRS